MSLSNWSLRMIFRFVCMKRILSKPLSKLYLALTSFSLYYLSSKHSHRTIFTSHYSVNMGASYCLQLSLKNRSPLQEKSRKLQEQSYSSTGQRGIMMELSMFLMEEWEILDTFLGLRGNHMRIFCRRLTSSRALLYCNLSMCSIRSICSIKEKSEWMEDRAVKDSII